TVQYIMTPADGAAVVTEGAPQRHAVPEGQADGMQGASSGRVISIDNVLSLIKMLPEPSVDKIAKTLNVPVEWIVPMAFELRQRGQVTWDDEDNKLSIHDILSSK